jgi:hypothetical protein
VEIPQEFPKFQEEVAKAKALAPEDTRQFAEKEICRTALMANKLRTLLSFT